MKNNQKVGAVIVAAGRGERMGGLDKMFDQKDNQGKVASDDKGVTLPFCISLHNISNCCLLSY